MIEKGGDPRARSLANKVDEVKHLNHTQQYLIFRFCGILLFRKKKNRKSTKWLYCTLFSANCSAYKTDKN